MRRGTTLLSFTIILGLAAALIATPVFAQGLPTCEEQEEVSGFPLDCDSDFGEGLNVTAVGAQPEDASAYRFYDVKFTGKEGVDSYRVGAYIPERFNSQAIIVKVRAGVFAFRTQGEGVIVDPQGKPLEKLIATSEIGLGEDPEAGLPRDYNDGGVFNCEPISDPNEQKLCLLDPNDFFEETSEGRVYNTFVKLEPGDTVYLPDNSTCFVCNTNRINSEGNEDPEEPTPAELLIWTPATGFDGDLQRAASAMATPVPDSSPATPSAQSSTTVLAWAFNPGGRCN